MAGETRRRNHLWALAVPILMGLAGWLVGLLLFDVFGAGYLGVLRAIGASGSMSRANGVTSRRNASAFANQDNRS
jgi:hypothetical protein